MPLLGRRGKGQFGFGIAKAGDEARVKMRQKDCNRKCCYEMMPMIEVDR